MIPCKGKVPISSGNLLASLLDTSHQYIRTCLYQATVFKEDFG